MSIYAIVNILIGIGSLLTGESTAEVSWGKANVLAHDKFYEQGYGFAFILVAGGHLDYFDRSRWKPRP
jgi:hypothetical protein